MYPHCTLTVSQLNPHCILTVPQCTLTVAHCTLTVTPLYPPCTLNVSSFPPPPHPLLPPNPTVPQLNPHCALTVSSLYPTVLSLYPHCIDFTIQEELRRAHGKPTFSIRTTLLYHCVGSSLFHIEFTDQRALFKQMSLSIGPDV